MTHARQRPATSAWSLRLANQEQHARLSRKLRIVVLGSLGLSLASSALASVALEEVGVRAVSPVVIAVFVGATILVLRWLRTRWSKPLEASVLVGTWMAKQGLVDEDGRLTPHAEVILAGRVREIDQLAVTTAKTSVVDEEDIDREVLLSLAAYDAARWRYENHQGWLGPLEEAAAGIDTGEVRAYLEGIADKGSS